MTRVHRADRPEHPAMYFGDRVTTYALLDERSNQAANGLIAEGLKPQTRIAILDKNSDAFFEVLFAAAKSNIVLVAVNWRLSPTEIAYVINDAEAELLFVGQEYFSTIEQIRAELASVTGIISLDARHGEWAFYEEWREAGAKTDPNIPVTPDDVALQLYTSGTTGHPKGAQLTNASLLTLMPAAVKQWGDWSERDVSLVSMPLFHIGGTGYALVGFFAGASNAVVREVDCREILKVIGTRRVTKTFWVPALILFLLQTPEIEAADLSSLQLIIYGASPMPKDLVFKAMAVFKCDFAQVYGLTETTGAVTWLPPEEHLAESPRMGSCGRPMAGIEIRVVDGEGRELPRGEIGEIICKTPQNMKGYWKLPEATASTIRGEWLYTGDAGYLDDAGFLYVQDRIKDMIISGGENIYPAEIESCLFGHPAVGDVAVIGIPDDQWGESVKAVVVLKPEAAVTERELIEFARERIAHYKSPKSVDFVEALPRNPSGKILKRELRKPYWVGRERQVN
jgi:acyl-CoA synthetase (AMP-forming)/AMP-acid ligase II